MIYIIVYTKPFEITICGWFFFIYAICHISPFPTMGHSNQTSDMPLTYLWGRLLTEIPRLAENRRGSELKKRYLLHFEEVNG